jgi:hypothetical protein
MRGIARIFYPDGELMVPAQTPYDVEILLDHAHWYATRYGGVRLELEQDVWSVIPDITEDPAVCSLCDVRLTTVLFVNGAHERLCRRCAQNKLHSRVSFWPLHFRHGRGWAPTKRVA